jgi:hypothetical protein
MAADDEQRSIQPRRERLAMCEAEANGSGTAAHVTVVHPLSHVVTVEPETTLDSHQTVLSA